MDANPTETCQAVAARIVKRVHAACSGLGHDLPILEEDVVRYVKSPLARIWLTSSVAEASASTSIAARMNYGVKRLLWL